MKTTRPQQIFYSGLAFLIGIAISTLLNLFFNLTIPIYWPLGVLLGIWILTFRRIFPLLIIIFCLFGFWRYQIALPTDNENYIHHYNEQKVTLTGRVVNLDPRPDEVKLTIRSLTCNNQKVSGLILITVPLFPEFHYGDELEISGRLQTPSIISGFNYKQYLAKDNIYSVIYSPSVKLLSTNKGNPIIRYIFTSKTFFQTKINQTIHEPQSALLSGILLGTRQNLPQELTDTFTKVGISHIIAISGYNITIIATLLMNLCLRLKINRIRAFKLIIAGLIFFVILTGLSASVVRAAIMGGLVLLAKHLGRGSKTDNVLMLTATIMCFINPKLLFFDAGFQLSFLATMGLIYLSPVLEPWLTWLPEKLSLRENATSTISAIIMTTPIILFQFQRFSVVAPIVNILVLPAIPISMLIGAFQLLSGIMYVPLGQMVGWFNFLVLSYVIKIAEWFSRLPFANVQIRIGVWLLIIFYLIIILIIKKARLNQRAI